MKKSILILTLFFVGYSYPTFAQLEVIDKVAEVLIPGIASGIKDVLSSNDGKKVKKEEVKKMGNELMAKTKTIVDGINTDTKNITALNELFSITGELYDNIGSMKSLTNTDLLNQIIATNSQDLFTETAIQFALQWKQVERKKDKLINKTANASSGSVQDDIAQYVSTIDDNLGLLSTTLSLTKEPSADMDLNTGKTYVKNLKRAKEYISEIEKSVNSINVQLSSRIRSLKSSLETAQSDIKKTVEDFNKEYSEDK